MVIPELNTLPVSLKPIVVLDSETTVMSALAPLFARLEDEKVKCAVSTSKPLCMDIAWTNSLFLDGKGYIVRKVSYAVKELIEDAGALDLAYYKDKIDIYFDRIERGEMVVKPWDEIITELVHDMRNASFFCAYNAKFDIRAIKYTERYITAKNANDHGKTYFRFLRDETEKAENIVNGESKKNTVKRSSPVEPYFTLRGVTCPVVDLWGMTCERLLNVYDFKKWAIENRKWSASVEYFTTNAEIVFQYLFEQPDFVESHTAIDDTLIETQILWKCMEKGELTPCLDSFPFRKLGTVADYVKAHPEHAPTICESLHTYLDGKRDTGYKTRRLRELWELEKL